MYISDVTKLLARTSRVNVRPHVPIFFVDSERNHEMNEKHRIIQPKFTELSELCMHIETVDDTL